MIITIDGPAGTGKTTVARELAKRLGYAYFDTGAMYRALTYQVVQKEIDLHDAAELSSLLEQFHFQILTKREGNRYLANGEDVTESIRTAEVTGRVSEVSAHPAVRQTLMRVQREFGSQKKAVFEGRDMGTVVFPQAEVKIFLTARPEVRAERRYLEIKNRDSAATEKSVLKEILERDHLDSSRKVAPLKQASDAHLIDTSDLTFEQVVEHILAFIQT